MGFPRKERNRAQRHWIYSENRDLVLSLAHPKQNAAKQILDPWVQQQISANFPDRKRLDALLGDQAARTLVLDSSTLADWPVTNCDAQNIELQMADLDRCLHACMLHQRTRFYQHLLHLVGVGADCRPLYHSMNLYACFVVFCRNKYLNDTWESYHNDPPQDCAHTNLTANEFMGKALPCCSTFNPHYCEKEILEPLHHTLDELLHKYREGRCVRLDEVRDWATRSSTTSPRPLSEDAALLAKLRNHVVNNSYSTIGQLRNILTLNGWHREPLQILGEAGVEHCWHHTRLSCPFPAFKLGPHNVYRPGTSPFIQEEGTTFFRTDRDIIGHISILLDAPLHVRIGSGEEAISSTRVEFDQWMQPIPPNL